MNTILLVFAHPDDESFSAGGTVAKYVQEGWAVHLLCVTNGEEGITNGARVYTKQELLPIRRKELKCAAAVLGIRSIRFLDKPDGNLQSLTPGTLEDEIIRVIEELLPDIVITHDTTGVTNHPDHIKVCYATTFAFQKYARSLDNTNQPKLYYACVPSSVVSFLQKKEWKGTPDKFITTVIDIQKTKILKGKALLCHESQKNNVEQFIAFDQNPLHNQEWFILRMEGLRESFMGKTDRVRDNL